MYYLTRCIKFWWCPYTLDLNLESDMYLFIFVSIFVSYKIVLYIIKSKNKSSE